MKASFLPPNFETRSDATREDIKRVKRLDADLRSGSILGRSAPKETRALLEQLERRLRTGNPQPTLASSLYFRGVRIEILRAFDEAFAPYADDELATVTVINTQWALNPSELDATNAATIRNQLRTHLQRAGILAMPGLLFGFLHGEFEPTSQIFQLHFHLLTTTEKAAAIKDRLVGQWGYVKTATGADPIKRQKVKNRPVQFSYLCKSFWPEKPVVFIGGKWQRTRKGQRIKGQFHTQYLLWLHRQTPSDMMLLNRCRYRNGQLYIE